MIHLDTSFLVDLLRESARGRPDRATARLSELEDEELAASVFVRCELEAGAELSRRPKQERLKVQSLCGAISIVYPSERFPFVYARLLAPLERAGKRIGNMDLLIATSAIVADVPLLTGNVNEFSRIPGLELLTF